VFAYHAVYEAPLHAHVFPMEKYGLVRARLLAEGDTTEDDWRIAPAASNEELALVHTAAYLDDLAACRLTPRTVSSEFPLDPFIVRAFVHMAGGSILAAREALVRGTSVNVGGGFHHAFADHAEGFCYINDIAVAIRVLQREHAIARAAVIDLDLHQGNGTAHIFHGDDTVFTYSMHQEDLYPVKQTSDLDVGLDDGTGDAEYLERLAHALPVVFERGRPDLVVYQAGADPYVHDQLGNLALSLEGLAERDRIVFDACTARGVPSVATFGGGYARDVADTVAIHVGTCRAALAAGGETRPSQAR
jgi:acetoin utilization deacetylase AcuC-like enzyme